MFPKLGNFNEYTLGDFQDAKTIEIKKIKTSERIEEPDY